VEKTNTHEAIRLPKIKLNRTRHLVKIQSKTKKRKQNSSGKETEQSKKRTKGTVVVS
jgi:hypothetical protein